MRRISKLACGIKFSVSFIALFLIYFITVDIFGAGAYDSDFGHTLPGLSVDPIGVFDGLESTKARALAIQADRKIVVAGISVKGTYYYPVVARYLPDGTIDSTFGVDGRVQRLDVRVQALVKDIAIMPNGNIVLAGNTNDGGFFVMAYTRDGLPVSYFGESGMGIYEFPVGTAIISKIAALADGSMVLCGYANSGTSTEADFDALLVKIKPDGVLDTAFGDGGFSITDLGTKVEGLNALTIAPDLKIFAVGSIASPFNDSACLITRFNADGSLDSDFGSDGVCLINACPDSDSAVDIALLDDGRVLAAGTSFNGSDKDFCVVRCTADGLADPLFNNTGVVKVDFAGKDDVVNSISVSSTGDLFLSGRTVDGSYIVPAFASISSDGSLNTSFNSSGMLLLGGLYNSEIVDSEFTSDGKLAVVTDVKSGEGTYLAVSCLNQDGNFDSSFLKFADKVTVRDARDSIARGMSINTLTTDGYMYAVADTENADSEFVSIAKFDRNGSSVASFGSSGVLDFRVADSKLHVTGCFVNALGGPTILGYLYESTDGFQAAKPFMAGFDSNGVPLTSFGNNGFVSKQFGAFESVFYAGAVQSDGKIVLCGYDSDGTDEVMLAVRYNQNGTLDTAFGVNGAARYDIGGGPTRGYAVKIDSSNGDVYIGGSVRGISYKRFAVFCLKDDGSLNSAFDGGSVSFDFGSEDCVINSIDIMGLKVLVAGSFGFSNYKVALALLNKDGSLATGFGTNGKLLTTLDTEPGIPVVKATGTDSFVLSNFGIADGKKYFQLTSYDGVGALDTAFGNQGEATAFFGDGDAVPYAVCIEQPDDNIILAGYSHSYDYDNISLARFTPAGKPDYSFGLSSFLRIPFPGGSDSVNCGTLLENGNVLLAGYVNESSVKRPALIEYDATGFPDSNFAGDGKLILDISESNAEISTLLQQPDGKILAAGNAYNGSDYDAMILRLNEDGTLDTAFASNGVGIENLPMDEKIIKLLPADDGGCFAIGYTSSATASNTLVLKYDSTGVLDSSFGSAGNGIVSFDAALKEMPVDAVLFEDGGIAIAGITVDGNNAYDVYFVKLNQDGVKDDAFGQHGILVRDLGSDRDVLFSIDSTADDAFVVAAKTGNQALLLKCFVSDGSEFEKFGDKGIVELPTDGELTIGMMVKVQKDEKIVVSSTVSADSNIENRMFRFNAYGGIDDEFADGGTASFGTDSPFRGVWKSMFIDGGEVYIGGANLTGYAMLSRFVLSEPPVITLASSVLNYPVDYSALSVDSAVLVSDPDGNNEWNGGRLEISITANADSNDFIKILPENDISVADDKLFRGEVAIGTVSPLNGVSQGSQTLTISFNSSAGTDDVRAVAGAVAFYSEAAATSNLDRTVEFRLFDGLGLSASASRNIHLLFVPRVTTGEADSVSFTEAELAGELLDSGLDTPFAHGFCWSTEHEPTVSDTHTDLGAADSSGTFTFTLTGLEEGAVYFVRAYAENSEGVGYGDEISFTTLKLPAVRTLDVNDIAENSAVLNAELTFEGVPSFLRVGLCWGTKSEPDISGEHSEMTTVDSDGSFLSSADNLLPGTMYYYRAYAENANGIVYGDERTFITTRLPEVETLGATILSDTEATLNGRVYDPGVPAASAHGFCWGTAANPDLSGEHTDYGAASAGVEFSENITVVAGETYHVRAYAENSAGVFYGDDVVFTVTDMKTELVLGVDAGGGGTTEPEPGTYTITQNSSFSIAAVPERGFHFSRWNIVAGTPVIDDIYAARTSLAADSTATVNAVFEANMMSLNANPAFLEENGASGTVTVILNHIAETDVVVNLSSGDPTRLSVPASVVVPAGSTSVGFSVSAPDNSLQDGIVSIVINAQADGYSDAATLLTVTDDDSTAEPGILLSPKTATTIEEGAGPLEISAVLTAPPSSDVVVLVSSTSDVLGVSPAELRFTATDWNVARQVSFEGIDNADNGDTECEIVFSVDSVRSDAAYDGIEESVQVSVMDDDPSASDITLAARPGETMTINIKSYVSDPQGDSVVLREVSQPASGTAEIADNGIEIIFQAPAQVGDCSFTYTVEDGNGGVAVGEIRVSVMEKICIGSVVTVEASNISELNSASFVKLPKVYGKFNDALKNKERKSAMKPLSRELDGPVQYLWKGKVSLVDFRAFKKSLKEGVAPTDWLNVNKREPLDITLFAKVIDNDGNKHDSAFRTVTFMPPEITSFAVNGADVDENSSPSVANGDVLTVRGRFFGTKAPYAAIAVREGDAVKLYRMKVEKPYKFADAKGRVGRACTDPYSGESEINCIVKFKSDNISGDAWIVIYNKCAIACEKARLKQ